MKVLMLNGSPRKDGNTSIALEEMKKIFEAEGVETEIVRVGNKDVRGCIACGRCYELGKCVFDDVVNELAPKFEAADGLVIASPRSVSDKRHLLFPLEYSQQNYLHRTERQLHRKRLPYVFRFLVRLLPQSYGVFRCCCSVHSCGHIRRGCDHRSESSCICSGEFLCK